jgi:hypothetical protein
VGAGLARKSVTVAGLEDVQATEVDEEKVPCMLRQSPLCALAPCRSGAGVDGEHCTRE